MQFLFMNILYDEQKPDSFFYSSVAKNYYKQQG